ncbi:MAG: hypothetical protein M3R08_05155 [Bacteroidota bacterium]|nr:hypothetical protein [Bacteroidota bacterium]
MALHTHWARSGELQVARSAIVTTVEYVERSEGAMPRKRLQFTGGQCALRHAPRRMTAGYQYDRHIH